MLKKLFALGAAGALAFTLAACGDDAKEPAAADKPAAEPTPVASSDGVEMFITGTEMGMTDYEEYVPTISIHTKITNNSDAEVIMYDIVDAYAHQEGRDLFKFDFDNDAYRAPIAAGESVDFDWNFEVRDVVPVEFMLSWIPTEEHKTLTFEVADDPVMKDAAADLEATNNATKLEMNCATIEFSAPTITENMLDTAFVVEVDSETVDKKIRFDCHLDNKANDSALNAANDDSAKLEPVNALGLDWVSVKDDFGHVYWFTDTPSGDALEIDTGDFDPDQLKAMITSITGK